LILLTLMSAAGLVSDDQLAGAILYMEELTLGDLVGVHHTIGFGSGCKRVHPKVVLRNLRYAKQVIGATNQVEMIDQATLEFGVRTFPAFRGGFV
jgi:hypothetical protein